KSLALTGLIAIARLAADIGKKQKFQNYFRGGNLFGPVTVGGSNPYNVSIGSQQYPPVQIDYGGAGPTGDADENTASSVSYKINDAVQQLAAVLGHAPLGSHKSFTKQANATTAGDADYGLGMAVVQVGYAQGVGVDTQTASLPVTFNLSLTADCTLNVYAQATATFSMQPENGMLVVRSFI
ncbi:MAG: hypothetical protein CMJ25_03695, partial [Phycisphaerae bacterium]|nr:hypothetical protein [Phycisphaerae bacterium]